VSERKQKASNIVLVLGILFLGSFAGLELFGLEMNPLLPAVAAFCFACAAMIDRLDMPHPE
jgi:hypothetical protein